MSITKTREVFSLPNVHYAKLFAFLMNVKSYLTSNLHLPASVELLVLMRRMFSLGKEEFITAFDKWCDKWKEFLNERTLLISGKTTYTHRRLKTVRRSMKLIKRSL